MHIKEIAVGVALAGALALGALEIQVPASEPLDNFLHDKASNAVFHRKYLAERSAYMTAQKDVQKITQEAIDKATVAKSNFEDYLLRKKFTDRKDGPIAEPPKGVVRPLMQQLSEVQLLKTAYAYVFGKEDFESCGALPCTFTSATNWGASTQTLDTGSAINGLNTLKCTVTGATGCYLEKTITASGELWYQQYIEMATGFTYSVDGYIGATTLIDTAAGTPMAMNIEDYGGGTNRLTINGAFGYTDTGINLVIGTAAQLEVRFKVSATVGDVDIWLNNTTVGAPTYNGSGTMNTGTLNVDRVRLGINYVPGDAGDMYYDDAIIDSAFIGAGVVSTIHGHWQMQDY